MLNPHGVKLGPQIPEDPCAQVVCGGLSDTCDNGVCKCGARDSPCDNSFNRCQEGKCICQAGGLIGRASGPADMPSGLLRPKEVGLQDLQLGIGEVACGASADTCDDTNNPGTCKCGGVATCSGLSDTCVGGTCGCGDSGSGPCDEIAADSCKDGLCFCGLEPECNDAASNLNAIPCLVLVA
jgi:hypothetical protein